MVQGQETEHVPEGMFLRACSWGYVMGVCFGDSRWLRGIMSDGRGNGGI